MMNRHDVPQPKLGLFLGTMWLGIWRAVGILPYYLNDWFKELFVFRGTARLARTQALQITALRKSLEESEEDRFYLKLDNEDLGKYMPIPSMSVHDAMKVSLVDDPITQALLIRVGGYRTTYSVSMMQMKEMAADDGGRYIAERVTRDNVVLFEEWLYAELCRELEVPEERQGQTYYPDRRRPENMFERRMKAGHG